MDTVTMDCTACTGETCNECGGTGKVTDALTETLREVAARLYADVLAECQVEQALWDAKRYR